MCFVFLQPRSILFQKGLGLRLELLGEVKRSKTSLMTQLLQRQQVKKLITALPPILRESLSLYRSTLARLNQEQKAQLGSHFGK